MWSRLDGEVGLMEGVWPGRVVSGELSKLLVKESEGIAENTGELESVWTGDAEESGKMNEVGGAGELGTIVWTDSAGDIRIQSVEQLSWSERETIRVVHDTERAVND